MFSFKPTFSLSSFTLIKTLFSSSLLSAIRVVPSVYLRLLIFLPAFDSSSLEFRIMYSAYRLQYTALSHSFPDFEPVSCFMSYSNCCFLTCIQVFQETCNVVWYSHLFKNSTVCCDPQQTNKQTTVKGFSIVKEAEVVIFLEFLYFL